MRSGSNGSSPSASNASALLAAAAFALVASSARADEPEVKRACLESYESAQVHRQQGHLLDARQSLQVCTREACPPLVRTDCAHWLDDIEQALPSIVVQATADGQELVDVTVYVDGAVVKRTIDGKATAVDPGPHAFRFEAPGFAPVETSVVIREGEHYRPLPVVFHAPPAKVESAPLSTAPVQASRPVPAAAWILGGVSLVATASFIGWGIAGYERKRALEANCAPFCAQSDVDTVRQRYLFSDVSLAVAVASLGAASFLYLTRRELPLHARVAIAVAPDEGRSACAVRISGDF